MQSASTAAVAAMFAAALMSAIALAPEARAGGGTGSRASLASRMIEDTGHQQPLYQASPVTHIIPTFNTVTYALEAQLLDTEATTAARSSGAGDSLKLKGYSYTPYIALSLRRVGLGFNVEGGHREVLYESASTNQESSLDYRGLGVFGFFKFHDTRTVYSTLIVGGKSLAARHEVGESSYGDSAARSRRHDYGLTGYEAGLNVGLRLLDPITIIPWANYSYTDDSRGRAAADASGSAAMKEDLDLFWKSNRPFDYGLDFAVRFARYEIRVGGLLGQMASWGQQSDEVRDQGYSVSLACDQKG